MAVTATPVFVQLPKLYLAKIAAADTTTLVTLLTAGTDGNKVVAINAVDAGADTPTVKLWVTRSAVDYLLVSTTVAVSSGANGTTAAKDLFTLIPGLPVDNDGQMYLFLESGDVLKASVAVTLGTGPVHLTVVSGRF